MQQAFESCKWRKMVSVVAGQAAIEELFSKDGRASKQYSELVTVLWDSLMAGELLPPGQGPHWPLIQHVCGRDHTGKALAYLERLPRVIGEVQQLLPAQEEVLLVTTTYHTKTWQQRDREWVKPEMVKGSWLKLLLEQRRFTAKMLPLANVARASVPGNDSLLRVLLTCELPPSYFCTEAGEGNSKGPMTCKGMLGESSCTALLGHELSCKCRKCPLTGFPAAAEVPIYR